MIWNNTGISEEVLAVYRNSSICKTVYKHCSKVVCNVMNVGQPETTLKWWSQSMRIWLANLFWNHFPQMLLSTIGEGQERYYYCKNKNWRTFDLMNTFFSCAHSWNTRGFRLFFSFWLFTVIDYGRWRYFWKILVFINGDVMCSLQHSVFRIINQMFSAVSCCLDCSHNISNCSEDKHQRVDQRYNP